MTDAGFEIDRTVSGKVKINIVSFANLVALVGLIATAVATWNGLTSKVDTMAVRVENAGHEVSQVRSDLQLSLTTRDGDQRELRSKVEQIGNRLTAVETVLTRVEHKLDGPQPQRNP